MRGDALYDLVLVLGYNDRTRVRGRGSAIFAHLARPGYTPTDGCIAFSREDMAAVLAQVRKGSAFLRSQSGRGGLCRSYSSSTRVPKIAVPTRT